MSLIRIALRIAAVEAIRGQTLVGDNVLDTPNGALDIAADGTLRTDEDRPFVAVSTDGGAVDGMDLRELFSNGQCMLFLEMGVAAAMYRPNPVTGVSEMTEFSIPASDRGFEFLLDVVTRQSFAALGDLANDWADIYRGLHSRVIKVERASKRTAADGQVLAGHQIKITLDLIDDPVPGEPLEPGSPLARCLARLSSSSDPVYQSQGAMMASLIGGNDPDWMVDQRRSGMTASELLALGRGPVAGDVDRTTPLATTATIAVDHMRDVGVSP